MGLNDLPFMVGEATWFSEDLGVNRLNLTDVMKEGGSFNIPLLCRGEPHGLGYPHGERCHSDGMT